MASSARRRSRSCASSSRSTEMPRSGWLAAGAGDRGPCRGYGRSPTLGRAHRCGRSAAPLRPVVAAETARRLPGSRGRRAGYRAPREPGTRGFDAGRVARRQRPVDDGRRDRRLAARGASGRHGPDSGRQRCRPPAGGHAAALSGYRAGRPRRGRRSNEAATGQPVRPVSRATGRLGHARCALDGAPGPSRRSRHAPRRVAPRRRRGLDAGPPRARGRTRGGHPDRPSRPGGSRGRGGVHDRRRQPRGGDLGLEHRDRRRRGRGDGRAARSSAPVDRHGRRDRRPTSCSRARRRRSCAPARWPASCFSRGSAAGRGRAAAALGWAAFLLLLADPGLVGDAGFQLSTLATAGLDRLGDATDRAPRPAHARTHCRAGSCESLGVSLAAQAATLPVVLASFGRLALISPVVNLLVVPLVAPAMAAGIVALVGGVLVSLGAPERRRGDPRGTRLGVACG